MGPFRKIVSLLIAVSFVFAGVSAQARPMPCPMAEKHIEKPAEMLPAKMAMEPCDGCPESPDKKETRPMEKSGCCDNATCIAKCSAPGGTVGKLVPSETVGVASLIGKETIQAWTDFLPPSHRLKTPERPPKHLS